MNQELVGLLAAGSLCGMVAVASLAAQERTSLDGVYTAEQVARGAKIYAQRCAGCHMPDEFTGEGLAPWHGEPAQSLFNKIRLTMPEEAPGSLTRQEYADVLAHIFALNGGTAGPAELDGTDEMLKTIVIAGPKKKHPRAWYQDRAAAANPPTNSP